MAVTGPLPDTRCTAAHDRKVLKPDMHMRSELATHPTQTILITTYFCILKCMKIIT